MADKAEVSTADYQDLANGHEDLHRRRGPRGLPARRHDHVARVHRRLINPFLVKSGLTKKQASLKGLFAPQFTQAYADGPPVVASTTRRRRDQRRCPRPRRAPGTRPAGGAVGSTRSSGCGARSRSARASRSRCSGSWRSSACGGSPPTCWSTKAFLPDPADTLGGLRDLLEQRRPRRPTCRPAACGSSRATRSASPSASCSGVADRQLPVGRGVLGVAHRLPALHPRHRAHAAVPAVARHRRGAQGRAGDRGHRLLQHPDDRRRRAAASRAR